MLFRRKPAGLPSKFKPRATPRLPGRDPCHPKSWQRFGKNLQNHAALEPWEVVVSQDLARLGRMGKAGVAQHIVNGKGIQQIKRANTCDSSLKAGFRKATKEAVAFEQREPHSAVGYIGD